jgi:hypothetical protein
VKLAVCPTCALASAGCVTMDGAELELVGGGVEDTVLLELHPSSVLKIEMKTQATTDRKKITIAGDL